MKSKKFIINEITTSEKVKPSETKEQPVDPPKEEEKPVPFFKLFRYATGFDKILLFIGGLCSVGTGVIQPLNMLLFGDLTGHIINYGSIIQGDITQEQFDEATNTFINEISKFAIYNSLLGLGMFIFSYLATVLYNYSAFRQIFKIRSLYLEKALNQDISWYDVNQTGDFASRMSDDLSKVEDGIGEKVSMFLHFQIAFLSALILALVKGWELALICLTSLPVIMICLGIVAFITSKIAKKESDAYGAAGSIAEEAFTAIRTVVSFGGEEKEINRYKEKLVFACKNNIKRTFMSGAGFGLLWFFIYGSYALAFWYGVKLILQEKDLPENEKVYGPGNMVTVFFSVMTGSMNFGMATPYIEAFGLAQGAASRIFSVIDNIPLINKSKRNGAQLPKINGSISFDNVKFHYPSRPDTEILKGLTLNIQAGDTVALVGSSGCGKSTCLQLVQRFYDPTSGSVALDGMNLKDLDLEWLRSNIGVVGQEPILFGTTIAENIKYGYKSATQEDIEKAAIKANAHHFIKLLPQGYDTLVGERGAQLSGGQKQRIAIARALVRNPAVLLLDEATSALDTNSEAKVQAALDAASKGCTTIIVAHRLSTIRNANKIVVINSGRVVEQGTHEELMLLKNEYFNLVTTQVSTDDAMKDAGNDDKTTLADFDDGKRASIVPDEVDMGGYEEETQGNNDVSLWVIMKMNSPEWVPIVVGCVSSLIMGAAMPVFAVIFGEILGILADDNEDYVRSETNKYCLYFVIAGIVTGISTFLMMYMFGIAGEKLTMRVRIEMFKSMLKQEMGWFDNKENGVGALCSKLSVDAAHVQGATGQRVGTILQSLSTLFLAVGLSMYYEWKLGLVALAFTPFILLATFLQQRLMTVENQAQHKSLQKSTKIAVESVGNVRTVASLGCEELFHQIYITELMPHHKISLKNTHSRALVFALARSLMFFAFSACMYYGGILISEGMEFAKVFKVSQSLIMGTVSIANALAFAPNFQKGLKAAGHMLKLLNRQSKVTDSLDFKSKDWEKSDIKYSDIYFSYPSRPNIPVLNNLNLSIFQNQTVALVGPSGCGKSTIIQLIERFYDPNYGVVSVDGEDLRLQTLKSLRSQLGIVSQEPNLFDRTIAENIAYGDNSRFVTMSEIIEAAKSANIHNFVASLPAGYDTRLGGKGTQLSGGQKQRVAIARALVRNPKVLLLDEATSALDTESEKIVQEALDNAKAGRTCIIIAHRLSTIQDADVICVINRGKVAEMGRHSELIGKKGLYHRLHTLQNVPR